MMRRLLATGVAVLFLSGCDGSGGEADPGPREESGATTSGTPVDPGPVVACPRDVVEPDPSLPDAVPEGATSVRLCDGGADRVAPPADALTSDVTAVLDAVNEQPTVDRPCADHQLPTYQLAFGYPDGTGFTVAGRFSGCGELLVGSARRAKAGPALRTFVDRLVAQRSTTRPPSGGVEAASLDCGQPQEEWTWPLAAPADLTVAVLCVGRPGQPEQARRVTIPARDLAILVDSMGRHTGSAADVFVCPFSRTVTWIVGANAWGDPVTLPHGCRGMTIHADTEWRPRGEARAIVEALVSAARPAR